MLSSISSTHSAQFIQSALCFFGFLWTKNQMLWRKLHQCSNEDKKLRHSFNITANGAVFHLIRIELEIETPPNKSGNNEQRYFTIAGVDLYCLFGVIKSESTFTKSKWVSVKKKNKQGKCEQSIVKSPSTHRILLYPFVACFYCI